MKTSYFLPAIILSIASCSSGPGQEFSVIDGFAQGTTYHIVFEASAKNDPATIRKGVESIFFAVDRSMSIYNDSSVISQINRNISDDTDSLFRDVLRLSYDVWQKSGGVFDITVGPLVKAWGFGPDAIRRFDASKLDSLLLLVGMEKITLKDQRLIKDSPAMYLDMNAIAQGYTVDLVVQYLKSIGIDDCLVEIGGEVGSSGNKNGAGWKVGIDKPVDSNNDPGQNMEAVITLNNRALATSGNYRKFYVDNGVKYSHTIDPRTGYPSRHTLLSATILASDCAIADAFATACMVVGKDSAIAMIEKYDYLDGYLIWSDDKGRMVTWMSKGVRSLIREK